MHLHQHMRLVTHQRMRDATQEDMTHCCNSVKESPRQRAEGTTERTSARARGKGARKGSGRKPYHEAVKEDRGGRRRRRVEDFWMARLQARRHAKAHRSRDAVEQHHVPEHHRLPLALIRPHRTPPHQAHHIPPRPSRRVRLNLPSSHAYVCARHGRLSWKLRMPCLLACCNAMLARFMHRHPQRHMQGRRTLGNAAAAQRRPKEAPGTWPSQQQPARAQHNPHIPSLLAAAENARRHEV